MNDKLFIIVTVLSLLFSILYYIGIVRYFKLHIDKNDKYLENYRNLDKNYDKKVIISFTTTPEKINKIKPMLNSLLDQTVKVDQFVLNIPPNFNCEVPEEYKKMLNVFNCGKDYGCVTKLIPTLLREDDNSSIIILLNDNIIYGKDFIENLIEEYKKYKLPIINNKAILITPEFFNMSIYDRKNCNLDDEWIINNIKGEKKNFTYNENYKSLFI